MMEGLLIPDELRFAITRKCNGVCRHCYNQSGKANDRLSPEDFIRMLKDVHAINPAFDRITLTGGEPMIAKDAVLRITRAAGSLGIRVRLVTRGWELDTATCLELKAAGVTRIQIGLDSSGDRSFTDDSGKRWDTLHSWLRDDDQGFERTTNALKIAVGTGLDVSVRYSLCRSNLKDVVRTYRFVSILGSSKFKFRVLFPDGRAKSGLLHELISGEEMANAQYQLIKASKGSATVVEITQPCGFALPPKADSETDGRHYNAFRESCPCGTAAAFIDSAGDVKYCLFDEQSLGNVCESSFLSVWNSAEAKKARELRCPIDLSGCECSSFRLLYSRFGDYSAFMDSYVKAIAATRLT